MNTQGGASGSLSATGGKLNVSLTNGSTEGWHAQLVKSNIPFEQDGMYRISFKIQAEEDRSASFNAGKASNPWNSYSGYSGISLSINEAEFVFSFTMNDSTDLVARLVFDLGKSTSGVTISEVKIEKLAFELTALQETAFRPKVKYYPNPVSTVLHIDEFNRYQLAELFDMNGRILTQMDLHASSTSFNMESYPAGIYILRLVRNRIEDRIKIIKE